MRRLARRHGASYTVHEVVLDRCVVHQGKWQRRLLTVEPDDHPTGAQLMGSSSEDFGPAARTLADGGYDVIDLNFACPVRKVLRRGRGGHLLAEPRAARDVVRSTVEAAGGDTPVTLKMRRGLDHSDQSERNFFTILDGAFELGISAVTVHARTVEQRYTGSSDRAFLARVKKHVGDRVVLGSGDLFTARDCIDMIRETGVDGVTLARGAIGNPWIFRDCLALAAGRELPDPPSIAEQRRTIALHFAEAVKYYGEKRAGKIMRKFGIKYSRLHPRARQVRDAFIAVRSPDDFQHLLDYWYGPEA